MPRSTGIWLCLLVMAWTVLSACRATQAYDGDKRDREEIAVLKVPYYAKGLFITVDTIDAKKVGAEAGAKLGILPGHHVLAGRAKGFGQVKSGSPYTLDFIARAGATYALSLEQGRFSEKLTITLLDDDEGTELARLEVWP